jgi:hypothetical protein
MVMTSEIEAPTWTSDVATLGRDLAAAERALAVARAAEAEVRAALASEHWSVRHLAARDLPEAVARREELEAEVRRLGAQQAALREAATAHAATLRAHAADAMRRLDAKLAACAPEVRELLELQSRSFADFVALGMPGAPYQFGALVPSGLQPDAREVWRTACRREGLL